MNFLLDTCIISKLRKLGKYPDKKLENWIVKHSETAYFISTLTLGEIQAGISKLRNDEKQKKAALESWFIEELIPRFNHRVLPIDFDIVLRWERVTGECQRHGITIPVVDGLIAATAIVNNLIVVTENTKDFLETGAQLFNPWL